MANLNKNISAVVLTKNSEKTIDKCLKKLYWCNEIVVIDDYSSDRTIKFAKKYTANIYKKKLNNDFSKQRNFGIKKSSNRWVVFVDSDEYVTQKLSAEIKKHITDPSLKICGFSFRRKDYFLKHNMKYGPSGKNYIVRGVKKGFGHWINKQPEELKICGNILQLKNKLIHKREESLPEYVKKIIFYSNLESEARFNNGEISKIWDILIKPIGIFLKTYIIMFGFLDGIFGLILCYLLLINKFLVYSNLWNLNRNKKLNL
jgi:glycosyltransferase involved in cell wall biosynthesis